MVNELLIKSMREKIKLGLAEGVIKSNLISEGWPLVDIEEAIEIEMKGMVPIKAQVEKGSSVWQYLGLTLIGLVISMGGAFGIMKLLKKDIPIPMTWPESFNLSMIFKSKVVEMKNEVPSPTSDESPVTTPGIVPYVQTSLLSGESYVDKKDGYAITPPKNWEIDTSGKLGAPVFFFGPVATASGSFVYKANINVTTGPANGWTVDGYVPLYLEGPKKNLDNYSVTDQRKILVAGRPMVVVRATFKKDNETFRNTLLLAVDNDKAFIVSGIALDAGYESVKQDMDLSIYSFILL